MYNAFTYDITVIKVKHISQKNKSKIKLKIELYCYIIDHIPN